MRHQKKSRKLSRKIGPRRALLRNMVIALLKYQRIKTTKAKAKVVRSFSERLISLGKKGTLEARRNAFKLLNDKTAVGELFSRIAPIFKNRTSGFTRVIHVVSKRRGDGAEMVFLELTEKLPGTKPVTAKKSGQEKDLSAKDKQTKSKPEIKAEDHKQKISGEKNDKNVKSKKFLGGLRTLFKKERDSV